MRQLKALYNLISKSPTKKSGHPLYFKNEETFLGIEKYDSDKYAETKIINQEA